MDKLTPLPLSRPPVKGNSTTTRRAFIAGASIAGLGLAIDSGTRERHRFEITQRTFGVRRLPNAFQDFRFVQISDLHLEEYTEAWFLEEIVRQVNALKPELVVVTGDYISHGPLPYSHAWRAAGACAEILSGLKAPQRYGILGNHDVIVGSARVVAPLESHGLHILVNRHVSIERGSDRIWLCGLDDAREGRPDLDLAVPLLTSEDPVILLCHEPDYADNVRQHPRYPAIDLMLSGHTHGGQVRFPLIGPLFTPSMGRRYVQGPFHFDHMQLYVNRGIGTVDLPFRLNCQPEITQITLIRA
jgi:predicted MPP superfamily phosphohydrolase